MIRTQFVYPKPQYESFLQEASVAWFAFLRRCKGDAGKAQDVLNQWVAVMVGGPDRKEGG